MKATIEEVKLPAKGSEKEIAHLLVKIGTDTFDVYLCPKPFLDDMGVNFSQGEKRSCSQDHESSRAKPNSFSPVKWYGETIPSFYGMQKATLFGVDIGSNLRENCCTAPCRFPRRGSVNLGTVGIRSGTSWLPQRGLGRASASLSLRAFVASQKTMWGNRDDRAWRLDRHCLQSPTPRIAFLPDSANCHRPDAAGIGFREWGRI